MSTFTKEVPYELLFLRREVPAGIWIFSDLERLKRNELNNLYTYYDSLHRNGIRVLNHPTKFFKRYELLRRLHDLGINSYNIYRLDEDRRNLHYPVFIREADEHSGSMTELVYDAHSLEREIGHLTNKYPSDSLVIVEYLDYQRSDGLFLKYSTYCIGDNLVPAHMVAGKRWMLKRDEIVNPGIVNMEWEFLKGEFFFDEIQKVFEIVHVNFGRIDFAIVDDKIQIFELNTAPTLGRIKSPEHPRYEIRKHVTNCLIDAFEVLNKECAKNVVNISIRDATRNYFKIKQLLKLFHALIFPVVQNYKF